jgi:uncharacterized protein (TIGR03435 family)
MTRVLLGTFLIACAAFPALAEDAPKFDAADVHVSPKPANPSPNSQFFRTSPVRGGRYEIKNATMLDLVRTAYGFNADRILDGPNWLELDRYDVIAKVPNDTTPENQKLMLRALLAERFKLVAHEDKRPLPQFFLVAGKKPQLKEAAGTEENGCHPQTSASPVAEGAVSRIMTMGPNGKTTTFDLGPGQTVSYQCRNITMQQFVGDLRSMFAANVGANPVIDETGLKGAWNFDLRYSISLSGGPPGDQSERIPFNAALEKQLGLKLEERPIPTPVLVVDSAERAPAPNPPGTAEALPAAPAIATEFEVASIKPTPPDRMFGRFMMQPGGRLVAEGMPLRFLIQRAFNTNNNDQIAGLGETAINDRYDINAKVPVSSGMTTQIDNDAVAPLMLNLFKDRFKLTYHTENRDITAYALVAAKPKLKKADPASRIRCRSDNAPAGSPSGSRLFTCQNVTMAQFAERLQGLVPDLQWPVADATGLDGSYDLSIVFQMRAMRVGGPPPPPPPGAGGGNAMPNASEPVPGQTLFEAVEKQLGLKLEKQKRSLPVIVIDHIESKPTEN